MTDADSVNVLVLPTHRSKPELGSEENWGSAVQWKIAPSLPQNPAFWEQGDSGQGRFVLALR